MTFFITPFHYTDCFSVRQIGYGGKTTEDEVETEYSEEAAEDEMVSEDIEDAAEE